MKKFLFFILALCSLSAMAYSDLSWTSPSTISTAFTNASDPRVVIDSSGNVTAAWVENNVIMTSSLPSGGSWSTPASLSNVLNTASSPRLGIDSSGNVTALWIESTLIKSALLPSGGSWGTTTTVSGSGATKPVMVVDASGNAVAVWSRSGFVESSTRKTGTWSLVSVISGSNSTNPHVAISSFGTAIAAWHSTSAGSDVIVTDILTISSNTWAATKNVFSASAAFFHDYPKVALDASGNAIIAWYRYNVSSGAYQNVQVITAALTQGAAAWGSVTIMSANGIRNPADLTIKLRFDTSGDALAVWTNSYDGETFSVESAQKLFGGSWPGSIIPQAATLYSFGFDLSMASGTALLANMAWDEVSNIMIQTQESDTTNPVQQGWTSINPVTTGTNNGYPQSSLSLSGSTFYGVIVWINFDGSNTVIQASTGTGSVIDPPSSVSATQNVTSYGVYNDYYNTITWTGSSDPDVIQYNIYRNGIYFGATDPGTLTFVDHNATNGGTVVYGVAALTSAFRQSAIVTYTLN